jgi:hypothetical protein
MPDQSPVFGGLNVIFAGDMAQLPPPSRRGLFSYRAANTTGNGALNGSNPQDRTDITSVTVWRQVDNCVVLKTIMRQKEERFIHLLGRLRYGACTKEDKALLDRYVLLSENCSANTSLTRVSNWMDDPKRAAPLISYTNAQRDLHNMRTSKAFAETTGQGFHVYHSMDTIPNGRGKGSVRVQLRNLCREAAWNLPFKDTADLGGRLPLIPGMPVFLVKNLATELGLSNGSPGTLVSVKYTTQSNHQTTWRYAISVEVDFPSYTNSKAMGHCPHRVTLEPCKVDFNLMLSGQTKGNNIQRLQIPIIPGFAYTAHNSQGCSLDAACIDLATCRSTAAAYVMLSRLRSLDGLCILRPFPESKITTHVSQEVRDELRRLDGASEHTEKRARDKLAWYYGK